MKNQLGIIGLTALLAGCASTLSAESKPIATQVATPAVAKQSAKQLPKSATVTKFPPAAATPEPPAVDISYRYQYKVRGQRYKVFKHANNFQEIGMASWYGPGFHGKKTANGETYNMHAITAAHKTLPLGTKVRVTNLSNGKKIVVRINDRGPFHSGRIIDLSKKAAQRLGVIKHGSAKVHIRIVEK